MEIIQTNIKELIIIKPDLFVDKRGYLYESFNNLNYFKIGLTKNFVLEFFSKSKKNTVRGLHYQIGEFAQDKLITVIQGKILDVAVDIRFGSPNFGKYFSVELSDQNHFQFWIPAGFAHGFEALEDNTILQYKCTNYYSKENERGIIYNDSDIGINWRIKTPIISDKDLKNPLLKNIEKEFIFEK